MRQHPSCIESRTWLRSSDGSRNRRGRGLGKGISANQASKNGTSHATKIEFIPERAASSSVSIKSPPPSENSITLIPTPMIRYTKYTNQSMEMPMAQCQTHRLFIIHFTNKPSPPHALFNPIPCFEFFTVGMRICITVSWRIWTGEGVGKLGYQYVTDMQIQWMSHMHNHNQSFNRSVTYTGGGLS